MKSKRFLFLVMALCFASGMKAQFYDGPDDIYYYVCLSFEYDETKPPAIWYVGAPLKVQTGKRTKHVFDDETNSGVLIFNFDGEKAALLMKGYIDGTKSMLKKSPSCFDDLVESTEYDIKYVSSDDAGIIYKKKLFGGKNVYYIFSPDRNTLTEEERWKEYDEDYLDKRVYKRVDKSFFRVGRSRTPSSTLHE